MAFIRTLFFYLLVVLSFLIGTTLTFLKTIIKPGSKTFRQSAKTWAKLIVFASGTKVKIEGIENIPKNEPLVFVSNHQSAADILILLAAIPRLFRYVIKKELFNIPVFGAYLRWADHMPLDRGAGAKAVKSLTKAEDFLKENGSVLIFPEGTRSGGHELIPFKKGSMFLIFNTKARVVPIALDGSYKIISKGSIFVNPAKVTVRFGKPLSFETFGRSKEDYNKAIQIMQNSVQELLNKKS
ncbi:MAG: 1-acyl-sn-glycerol-3-phosphate acyltransferase [Candidatus Saganbacteria bacterium]|nr:1-acyl-sn-glycerol-3-phosphate acyltransferase [Candidatus Saganbacteria bacterium]